MTRIGTCLALVASLFVSTALAMAAGGSVDAAPVGSAFRPVAPCRLLDSRATGGGPIAGGRTIRIDVAGRCGTAADATAAALSVTVTAATGRGHVTAFADGTVRPITSNLNYSPHTTAANTVISPLGDGAVSIYVSTSAHVVVDVAGVFVAAQQPVTAGRLVTAGPTRILDTRRTGQRGTRDIVVPLPAGVSRDAVALAVTVTLVDAERNGFVSVRPAGTARRETSIVNADSTTRTRAVSILAATSAQGIVVSRSMETDVVIDITGWFTGPSAAASPNGLFVPQAPTRVLDSRTSNETIHPGGTLERSIGDGSYAAAVVNVTALDTVRPGFVSVHPAGTERTVNSTVNPRWRLPIANLAVAPVSTRGLAFYSNTGSRLLVDVFGWFTGTPQTATRGADANTMPTVARDQVLVVSDSAFAGIRWNGQLDGLVGAAFRADLESCRRLIGYSCRGREGYSPSNGVQAILSAPGSYGTLVMLAGYNDFAGTFPRAVDEILAAARARGITRIVWFTYREPVTYRSPQQASNAATFAANNVTLRAKAASGSFPEIAVLDWNAYSANRSGWNTSDGVHLTTLGAQQATNYISRVLAALDRRACPMPAPTDPGGWCAMPT